MGSTRAHLQLDAGARMGDVGRVPPPRGARTDDVRPDDGGLVDLYRDAGDSPGDLRDIRPCRPPALRRLPRPDDHAAPASWWDGRRPTPVPHLEPRRSHPRP